MGLSASLWCGVSGLLSHGEKMNVLGNNLANVNTVGFKGATMHFEDFMSTDMSTTARDFAQIGRGVSVAAVYGDFSQGSFETTNEATDLAVGGRGFFGVSPRGDDLMYFTRAGNFRFDKEGYLTDPHGYVLQGWEIERQEITTTQTSTAAQDTGYESKIKGVGVPTDVKLDGFTCEPQHTNSVAVITNLDSLSGGDNTKPDPSLPPYNPFFSLFEAWDGTQDEPLSPTAYAYQTTIKVYDEGGTSHNLSVYYDQVSNAEDLNVWEYIVTIDPTEDKRSFINGAGVTNELDGSSAAGLLMMGTLSFDSGGQLDDMSAFTLVSNADPTGTSFKDLSLWRPTAISQNGYPTFAPNFTGMPNASWVIDANGTGVPVSSNAEGKIMELNFGIKTLPRAVWQNYTPGLTAASIGTNMNLLPEFGYTAETNNLSTTSYAGTSSTLYQSQDGYSFGYLQNVTVDRDGILKGRYSNGITLELYQITLYDFQNKVDLRREGGNLFSKTQDSGEEQIGPANSSGLGSISSNSLEMSNVDMAREMVQMITTQRGFQANSKVITSTDQMLMEVIQLKR